MMADTGAAKLPGIPALQTTDAQLNAWAKAVQEHLEVRNGARGNPEERSVTQRELAALSRRIDLLEKQLVAQGKRVSTVTTTVSEWNTETSAPAPAPATTMSGVTPAELAAVKGDLSALSRRLRVIEVGKSTPTYGLGFEEKTVTVNNQQTKVWRIKADIGWDRGTGTNTFGASFDALRWAHYTSEGRELLNGAPALNPNMLVRGIDNIDMWGVADAARTLPPRVNAIENRFDGAGRLAWGHLPSYTTSFFRDASGNLFTVNLDLFCWSVEENISTIRAHLGI